MMANPTLTVLPGVFSTPAAVSPHRGTGVPNCRETNRQPVRYPYVQAY